MQTLLTVVLPIFLVIGFGYGAVRLGFFKRKEIRQALKKMGITEADILGHPWT